MQIKKIETFPYPKKEFDYSKSEHLFYTEKNGWLKGRCVLIDQDELEYRFYFDRDGLCMEPAPSHWAELPPAPNTFSAAIMEHTLECVYGEGEPLKVCIQASKFHVSVYVEGYGNASMAPNHGAVVHMENCNGKFTLDAFSDMNNDEAVYRIGFEDALESKRPLEDD